MKKLYGKDRKIIIEEKAIYHCNECDGWFEPNDFHNHPHAFDGIETTCKKCRKQKRIDLYGNETPLERHGTPHEVKYAKQFLELMGYDLDYNIHEQFLMRNKDRIKVY